MSNRFYVCPNCGNIIGMIKESGVKVVCCGQTMQELVANSTDAATEKHIPVVEVNGDVLKVTVGEVLHPMSAEHYIEWVYVQTENGGQRKALKPNDAPVVEFSLKNDHAIAVYSYCNLHGLWVKNL